jgi:hypothetical protein
LVVVSPSSVSTPGSWSCGAVQFVVCYRRLGQARSSTDSPVLARGGASCTVWPGSCPVLRAVVLTGYVWLSLDLSCALRCGGSPSSAHGGRGWPDTAWIAQGLRAAVQTGRVGVCSPSSCVRLDQFVSSSVGLGSCCIVALVASDPWIVGGRLGSG